MKEIIVKRTKSITSIIGAVFIIALLFLGMTKLINAFASANKKEIIIHEGTFEKSLITDQMVMEVIRDSGNLVTKEVGYMVQENYEKHHELFGHKVPFTTDETIIAFQGTIGIGIDLRNVEVEVNNSNKIITLILPSPECIYNEIDNESLFTGQTKDSIFTEFELEELAEVELNFQKQKEEELLADGTVYHQATNQAEDVLKNLIESTLPASEYTVRFE